MKHALMKRSFMHVERLAMGRSCASCARGISASMHVMARLGQKKNANAAPGMACTIQLTPPIRHSKMCQIQCRVDCQLQINIYEKTRCLGGSDRDDVLEPLSV